MFEKPLTAIFSSISRVIAAVTVSTCKLSGLCHPYLPEWSQDININAAAIAGRCDRHPSPAPSCQGCQLVTADLRSNVGLALKICHGPLCSTSVNSCEASNLCRCQTKASNSTKDSSPLPQSTNTTEGSPTTTDHAYRHSSSGEAVGAFAIPLHHPRPRRPPPTWLPVRNANYVAVDCAPSPRLTPDEYILKGHYRPDSGYASGGSADPEDKQVLVPTWVPARDAGLFVEIATRFNAAASGSKGGLAAKQSIDIPGLYDDDEDSDVIDAIFSRDGNVTHLTPAGYWTPRARQTATWSAPR